MLKFDHLARVATAAVGALVLSTLSVAAAVGPGQTEPVRTVYASVLQGNAANG